MKYSLLLALCLSAFALGAADPNRFANLVILNETSVATLNLATVEAEESNFEETVFALGRIEIFPGKSATVSTRVTGRVISVLVEPDRKVEKGAELGMVESRQAGDPPPTVPLIAPISGSVTRISVQAGQPITADSSIMEIVDLSEVHAIARVPEHLAHKLKPGLKARIRVPGYPDDVFESSLEHLGTLADATTGTLDAVFHVANPERKLRPGMRAEFSIVLGEREGVMSVPREALQGDGTQRFVYVADYELKNAFVKTPVVVGAQNERLAEIKSGLFPGDKVVTRGAYALVFAGRGNTSLKEALDAAHGHAHAEDGSELTGEQGKATAAAAGSGKAGGTQGGFSTLAMFFAGTTGVLLILLIAMGFAGRSRTNA